MVHFSCSALSPMYHVPLNCIRYGYSGLIHNEQLWNSEYSCNSVKITFLRCVATKTS